MWYNFMISDKDFMTDSRKLKESKVARPKRNDIHVQTTAKKIDVAHILLLMKKMGRRPRSRGELFRFAIEALSQIAVSKFDVEEITSTQIAHTLLEGELFVELDVEVRFSRATWLNATEEDQFAEPTTFRKSHISQADLALAKTLIDRHRVKEGNILTSDQQALRDAEVRKAIQYQKDLEESQSVSDEDKKYTDDCYNMYQMADRQLLERLEGESSNKRRDSIRDQRSKLVGIFGIAVNMSLPVSERLKALASLEQINIELKLGD
jgi:hypothetical protein